MAVGEDERSARGDDRRARGRGVRAGRGGCARCPAPASPKGGRAGRGRRASPLWRSRPAATSDSSGDGSGKIDVVATTTQIGDWARAVGGDAVDVHQILKPNSDPHEYEPRPADVQAAAGADVVFQNGDNLDAWAGELVEGGGRRSRRSSTSASVGPERLPGDEHGAEASRYDPHWWHDPRNAESAVSRDPRPRSRAHRARATGQIFERNARAYRSKLAPARPSDRGCIDRVPRAERKLVTDHDAFGYFARRYGLAVVGAVIPSQTTEAQPSAGELAELADVIRREHVRAVFPESSISPKLARAIADETGASADLRSTATRSARRARTATPT